jgi:hypothetical protein
VQERTAINMMRYHALNSQHSPTQACMPILWHEHAGACGKHRSPRPRLAPHSPSASTRSRQSTLARQQPRAIKKTRDVARALTTPAAPFARRSPPRLHETNTLGSQPQPLLLLLLLLHASPWVRAAALHRDVLKILFSRHDAGRGRSQVCSPYASAEFALDRSIMQRLALRRSYCKSVQIEMNSFCARFCTCTISCRRKFDHWPQLIALLEKTRRLTPRLSAGAQTVLALRSRDPLAHWTR